MPRRLCGAFPLAVLLGLTGCGQSESRLSAAPPKYSYGPPSYDPARDFKDDAPTNKQLAPQDVPLTFLDHEGKPVDLAEYRGKSNVVLVVVRGMPQKPG